MVETLPLGLERRQIAEAEADWLGRDRRAVEPEAAGGSRRGLPALPEPEETLRQPSPTRPAKRSGREDRWTKPAAPSAHSRASHLRTVLMIMPKLERAAAAVQPP